MNKVLASVVVCCCMLLILQSCDNYGSMYSTSVNPEYSDNVTGEKYDTIVENPFVDVREQPVSTFSIDCDGGSYSNMRRLLNSGSAVPANAIRTEELVNYFQYNYPEPAGAPVGVSGELCICPWNTEHKLIRIGIKGRSIAREQMPNSNIVLLIDVSGSMSDDDKLPLIKKALTTYFVPQMRERDKLAIVTYAGADRLALGSTSGSNKQAIINAINGLGAGGGTAGAKGITSAYDIARQNFIEGGNNRVILLTDGDFNIGVNSTDDLVKLIEEKRKTGIFLSTIGVGTGNYNDAMMEQIADHGNGIYEYMDDMYQAKKMFVDEYSKYYTVAKDVKVQVVFNPQIVKQYRLIGYENRILSKEQFTDDSTDAGDISAGQTVTALYEIETVPYRTDLSVETTFTIDFRYKEPNSTTSVPLSLDIHDYNVPFASASEDTRFASSVAALGLILRDSKYKGTATKADVQKWATAARTFDPNNYRSDFISLLAKVNK
ncbi:MAG: von Willebrand factor type A domain-containing protein [Candidatus Kapabacteria bacterium]|nr:von Willebrand factor type A domain-containing protein [Candidatus Kapabacteria bacterium]